MNTPTISQATAYQGLFDYFNESLFAGRLPACLLNLSRKSRCYGFFAPDRWEAGSEGSGDTCHEISLNPDTMAGRDPRDVAGTLVHEMCHLEQDTFGKPGKRGYHNREFAKMMARVGLVCSNTGAPGGAETGTKMTHYIEANGAFDLAYRALPDAVKLPWLACAVGKAKERKVDRSKLKHTCAGCGSNVWGKAGTNATCVDCDQPFVCEDSDDDDSDGES